MEIQIPVEDGVGLGLKANSLTYLQLYLLSLQEEEKQLGASCEYLCCSCAHTLTHTFQLRN